MYGEVLRLIPFMKRYAEHYDLYDQKRNLDSLSTLTLQELWIMNTIERIEAPTAPERFVHLDF
ncbi:hypothetical protein B9G55_11880 [Saccharibacillus sp. O16]|nr:hypothetical protein B9G55_11880 [Saccharibacillus sp. O16]